MVKVGYDLDGVVANYIEGLTEIIQEKNPEAPVYHDDRQLKDYDLISYPASDFEVGWGFNQTKKRHNFFYNLDDIDPVATEDIRLLSNQSTVETYFITNRSIDATPDNYTQSALWLEDRGLPTDNLWFTKDKGTLARQEGLDFFIDNYPSNAFGIRRHSPETDVFLLKKTYNQDIQDEFNSVDRVTEYNDVVRRYLENGSS